MKGQVHNVGCNNTKVTVRFLTCDDAVVDSVSDVMQFIDENPESQQSALCAIECKSCDGTPVTKRVKIFLKLIY